MEKEFVFDDELDELNEQNSYSRDKNFYLTEADFYPPSDNRVWKSNVEDIDNGDNFADYCRYIFNVLNEEEYFDN